MNAEIDSGKYSARWEAATAGLWASWLALLDRKGIGPDALCYDGPGVPESYFASSPRLLFVLREPNNCRGGALLALLRTEAKHLAWRNVARWAAGIQRGSPPFAEVLTQQAQNEALRQIAAVNIKKSSGGSSSSLSEVHRYAVEAAELHRTQLALLRPDMIVAAGTIENLQAILALSPQESGNYTGVWEDGQQYTVVPWRHPSARGFARDGYLGLRDRVSARDRITTLAADGRE